MFRNSTETKPNNILVLKDLKFNNRFFKLNTPLIKLHKMYITKTISNNMYYKYQFNITILNLKQQ